VQQVRLFPRDDEVGTGNLNDGVKTRGELMGMKKR